VASIEPHFGCQRFQLGSCAWSSWLRFTLPLCSVFLLTVHVVCSIPARFSYAPPVSRGAPRFGSIPPEFLFADLPRLEALVPVLVSTAAVRFVFTASRFVFSSSLLIFPCSALCIAARFCLLVLSVLASLVSTCSSFPHHQFS
jgi:hypothetical protein